MGKLYPPGFRNVGWPYFTQLVSARFGPNSTPPDGGSTSVKPGGCLINFASYNRFNGAAAFLAAVLAACASGGTISPGELIRNASAYDGKSVHVAGTVRHVMGSSDRFSGTLEFELCDASSCVHVYQQGKPDVGASEGESRLVIGTFSVRKEIGPSPFFYEIEVQSD